MKLLPNASPSQACPSQRHARRIKAFMAASAVVAYSALGLLSTSRVAMATTLSDNTYQTSADSVFATATDWLAASFTTDVSHDAATLDAVLLANALSGTSSLSLFSSDPSGLIPGDALATFTSATSTGTSTAFSLSSIDLKAGTSYWLVLSNSTGESAWSWTQASEGTGTGFTGLWANSDEAGQVWFTNSNLYPLQLAVSISAVPEPSTTTLSLSSLPWLVLLAARRCRAQHTPATLQA
jgi:hypothetical protein